MIHQIASSKGPLGFKGVLSEDNFSMTLIPLRLEYEEKLKSLSDEDLITEALGGKIVEIYDNKIIQHPITR